MIENQLERIADQLERIAAALVTKQPTPRKSKAKSRVPTPAPAETPVGEPPTPAPEPENPPPSAEVDKSTSAEPTKITDDEMIGALQEYAEQYGVQEARRALSTVSAKRATEVPEEKRAKFVSFLRGKDMSRQKVKGDQK